MKRGWQTANSSKAGYWEEPRQMDVGPKKKPKLEKATKPKVQAPATAVSENKTSVPTVAGKIDVSVHGLRKPKKRNVLTSVIFVQTNFQASIC